MEGPSPAGPYGQPAGYDPYGQPDQFNQPEPYGPPYGGQPDHQAGDQYPQPPAPPPKKSAGLVIGLIAVLALVLCGGGVAAAFVLTSGSSAPSAHNSAGPTPSDTSNASPTASPSTVYDPTSIVKGQCVANDGTDADHPKLRVVPRCGSGNYLVLARFDGTKDTAKCDGVAGSTHNYFYDTTPDTLDFVLCLKQQ
jgi:hypothetical protein